MSKDKLYNPSDSLGKLFEELELPPGSSVLSWKDQVEKSNVKIIQPKIPPINSEKVNSSKLLNNIILDNLKISIRPTFF